MEELGFEYTKQRLAYTHVWIFSVLIYNLCIVISFLTQDISVIEIVLWRPVELFCIVKSRSWEILELQDLLKFRL
jgi:hypothetical protein